MHEVGLCEDVLDAVLRRADGRKVTGVRVRVGALHHVSDASFEQAFQVVSIGTEAENAVVDLVHVPVRVRCRGCLAETESNELVVVCPTCLASELDVVAGDELLLESIALAATAG